MNDSHYLYNEELTDFPKDDQRKMTRELQVKVITCVYFHFRNSSDFLDHCHKSQICTTVHTDIMSVLKSLCPISLVFNKL